MASFKSGFAVRETVQSFEQKPPIWYLDPVLSAERAALVDLAKATSVEGWSHNSNWLNPDVSVCDWTLVGCNAQGRVKLLTLDFNNLTGSLPDSLGNLTFLEDLDLEYNSLAGPLPSTIAKMGSLIQLGVGGNSMTGPIPVEICSNLQRIIEGGDPPPCDLSGNAFDCPLPCDEAATCNAVCNEGGLNFAKH